MVNTKQTLINCYFKANSLITDFMHDIAFHNLLNIFRNHPEYTFTSLHHNLTDETEKYSHNAWDNVELPKDYIEKAIQKLEIDKQKTSPITHQTKNIFWDDFYKRNHTNFFKDRKWITKEFPSLNCQNKIILELGCGVGNSLKYINQNNFLIGLDFSEAAIRMIEYEGVVCDITRSIPFVGVDYALFIFCLSAIDPMDHKKVFQKLYKALKKGGKVFFRDYGFMDMVQLRYKNEQCVGHNFYRRSDGTYTYFFEVDYLRQLVESVGFDIEQLFEDKRMLTNRKKKLDMYRVMIQGVFVKR